jgi:hypothetical protein
VACAYDLLERSDILSFLGKVKKMDHGVFFFAGGRR